MSINILDLLKGQLGGALIGQLGKQVGLDSNQAKSGMDAILPSILGGLMKKASTPQGADSLNDMLDQDDYSGSLLEKLPGMLGGGSDSGGSSMMTNLGMTVLSSLFGDKVASIAGMLAKVTGIGSDKSTSMMALLAPLVMSFLGAKKRADGLDAGGMASLLMSQKDSVASSLPPGMAGALGLGDLGITDKAPAARPAPAPAQKSGGSGLAWLLPLLILGGLAAWFLMSRGKPDLPAVNDIDLGVDVGDITPDVSLPDVGVPDLTSNLTGMFDQYKATLTDVTDEASAKLAVPKMEEYNGKLGGMAEMFKKLPAAAQSTVGGKAEELLAPIQAILDKLYAIPGVQAILEPVVTSMLDKVKAFVPSA
ncbi:hypothetical protein Poly51_54260 [Rubripirellula tenax]|uniref:DUF937 domain-containing protein n=1 Tax=Rubripirellula tenax TaxID=2528015 RepID=A0A5C6EGQ7_9BACT|nr:DUF937 domain-containing protein [Rubripirellula tenax]TWU47625.1 hypothetical protein Poly51_54260 [Rubripirellula tenax]